MSSSKNGKNIWDILELLINKGAIFTLVMLLFSSFILITAWRVPPEDLSAFWRFIGLISKTHWAISAILLIASNVGWWVFYKNSKRNYEKEIDRLTKLRQALMHGHKNAVFIVEHTSSDDASDKITMLTPTTEK